MRETPVSPRRWNTQNREDGLYICLGFHDKNNGCEFEKITPEIWQEVVGHIIRLEEKLKEIKKVDIKIITDTLQKEIWESTKQQAILTKLCIRGCDWLSDDGVCVSSTGCMYSQSQAQEKT